MIVVEAHSGLHTASLFLNRYASFAVRGWRTEWECRRIHLLKDRRQSFVKKWLTKYDLRSSTGLSVRIGRLYWRARCDDRLGHADKEVENEYSAEYDSDQKSDDKSSHVISRVTSRLTRWVKGREPGPV